MTPLIFLPDWNRPRKALKALRLRNGPWSGGASCWDEVEMLTIERFHHEFVLTDPRVATLRERSFERAVTVLNLINVYRPGWLLRDLNSSAIRDFRTWAKTYDRSPERPRSESTLNGYMQVFQTWMKFATDELFIEDLADEDIPVNGRGHMARFASSLMVKIKQEHRTRKPEAWTKEEMDRLLAHCRSITTHTNVFSRRTGLGDSGQSVIFPDRLLWTATVHLLWQTAWRISTLYVLTPSALDEPTGLIQAEPEENKAGKDLAKLLDAEALEAIRQLHGNAFPKWPYLLPVPWTLTTFGRKFRDLCRAAGLESSFYWAHKVRASSASEVEANGGDGTQHCDHSNRKTTRDSYLDKRVIVPALVNQLARRTRVRPLDNRTGEAG